MPVDVHGGETISSFVPNPILLAQVTLVFLFGKAKLDKNFMDSIMTYVLVMITLDETFQCAGAIILCS